LPRQKKPIANFRRVGRASSQTGSFDALEQNCAQARINRSRHLLFSGASVRSQQRFYFHYSPFRPRPCWFFRGDGGVHWRRRSFRESLAISLGTGRGSDADRSSLVFYRIGHGWVHDRFGTAWMLDGEALFAIVCTLFALFVLGKINTAQAPAD
jgi:hypothetical protein